MKEQIYYDALRDRLILLSENKVVSEHKETRLSYGQHASYALMFFLDENIYYIGEL